MILEQINSVGKAFVGFAGPMLMQSSVLIVILLLLDLVLQRKIRAVFRYCIWMLVLIKLILPTTLSSPVSLGYWFGDELANINIADLTVKANPVNKKTALPPRLDISDSEAAGAVWPLLPETDDRLALAPPFIARDNNFEIASKPIPAGQHLSLSWQGVVFLVWLAVVMVMVLLLLQRTIFVGGLVAQARNANSLMNDAFKYCCRCIGVEGKVKLKVSANVLVPAVCGLFRPVILVPENLGSVLGVSHLRTVLLHELAHIKRGDLWVNLAQTVLQIIYFYNPMLWLANAVIRRVREQAVDEAVLVAMGRKAQQYPEILVSVAKLTLKRPALGLRLIGVVESKSSLKRRIKKMLNRPVPKSANLGVIGLIAVVMMGSFLLPMAGAQEETVENIAMVEKADDVTPSESKTQEQWQQWSEQMQEQWHRWREQMQEQWHRWREQMQQWQSEHPQLPKPPMPSMPPMPDIKMPEIDIPEIDIPEIDIPDVGESLPERNEKVEHLSAPLKAGSTLAVQTRNGSITVNGADVAECSVKATISVRAKTAEEAKKLAEGTKIRLEPSGKKLTVKIEKPLLPHERCNCSIVVNFDITVPKQTSVDFVTRNGGVAISGIAGINVRTRNGAVTAKKISGNVQADVRNAKVVCEDISGDIKLSGRNGSVTLSHVQGNINARTRNGAVTTRQTLGNIQIETRNGKVVCEDISRGDVKVSTRNGKTYVAYAKIAPPICNVSIVSRDGAIDFIPPPEFSASVELSTRDGSIRSNLPLLVTGQIKKSLKDTIGTGEGKLHLQTRNGSITIK